MIKRFVIFALALSLLCLLFTSCEKPKERFTAYSFDYFDTVTTIIGYADSKEDFDEVADRVLADLAEYHKLFTTYHRFDGLENLCTINELVDGAHRVITVDRKIIDMLLYAREMHEKTGGKVNIAMGSVLSIWHEYRELGTSSPADAKLPPHTLLEDAAQHTDISSFLIDEENCTVTITDPKMKLDVGAIAKGWAVEEIARSLEADGITGFVLNIGGNVRTIGTKADSTPWTVGVENPEDDPESPYFVELSLSGESLVSSGTYQRYYIVDGKRYHHIIDPDTLYPAEGYLMVSIVTKSSADGDALSTALFCMSVEEGLEIIESLPGTEAMWVLASGEQITSSGFSNYVKK